MSRPERSKTDSLADEDHDWGLQVVLGLELPESCPCPLSKPDSAVQDVHNQIVDGVCRAEVRLEDERNGGRVSHTTNQVDATCLCVAFGKVEAIPRIRYADGPNVVVETYLQDRTDVSELISELNSVTERVSLKRLISRGEDGSMESSPATVDLASLTAKQREAATIAVREGYYETPRRTDLDALSEELDISKSALSQRLNAVEAKLASAVFER
ncbi:helix-turn-helix domain-containing protein [Haloarculaceae archaeon H-GB2-1]|nr:helix-turn-helix domain-containing protein [Haloarculaceae archaeon H-GB1-1]MEA5386270.1 helix-turn-helix domain-containing protein [Haloarculaceae archaeon H-GB11]MEA5407773.1 helix-turn-helix domain-containing protein [Haloarculaceae archaeon H-GB2-1]